MKSLSSTLLAVFFAATASAQTYGVRSTDIPDTGGARETKLVTDKAGRLNVLTVETSGITSTLVHYINQNGSWVRSGTIANSTVLPFIDGLDAGLDRDGQLHASFLRGTVVEYATLPPGAAGWQLQTVASNASTIGRARTSLDVDAPTPRMVYPRRNGATTSTAGVYALRRSDGTWALEDIVPSGQNAPIAGQFPAMDADPLPVRTGGIIFLGSAGPTLAYYEDGAYYLTQRSQGVAIFPNPLPDPVWSAPQKIADAGTPNLNADFFELDLAIQNNVLHLVCNGERPDGTRDSVLYYRRVPGSIFGAPFIESYEDAAEPIATGVNDRFDDMALTLDNGGTPLLSFTRVFSGQWSIHYGRRNGLGEWILSTPFLPPINFAGEPRNSSIATDLFDRPSVAVARENNLDIRVTSEIPFPLEQRGYRIGNGVPEVPAAFAVGSCGGTAAVVISGEDATFTYQPPSGGIPVATPLEIGLPSGNVALALLQPQVVPLGDGGFVVVTQTTSRDGGQVPERTVEIVAHRFLGATFLGRETLSSRTGIAVSSTALALAGSSRLAYLYSSGGILGTPSLFAFDLEGNRRQDIEVAFNSSSPPALGAPAAAARGGTFALLGRTGNTLTALWTLNGVNFNTSTVKDFGSAANFPGSFDLAVTTPTNFLDLAEGLGAIIAVYAEGNTAFVAHRSPIPQGTWSTLRAGTSFGGFDVGVAAFDRNRVHVLTRSLGGASPNQVNITTLLNLPTSELDLATATTTAAISPQSSNTPTLFTSDAWGFPAIMTVASDGNSSTLQTATSPLTRDTDKDRMPLFMELALCRDPDEPDAFALITPSRPDTVTVNGTALRTTTLTFERPPGPATVEGSSISGGIFRYNLEISTTLDIFTASQAPGFSVRPSGPSAPSSGAGPRGGVLQTFSTVQANPDPGQLVDRLFQRLRISFARDDRLRAL